MTTMEPLITDLGSPDWKTRRSAFQSLQRQGASILEHLIEGTAHPNWRVRRSCADLMDHLADSRCVDSLLRLLNDPIEAVRRLAVHALSCQGCKVCPLNTDIVAHLITVIQNDPSIRVRRVATHQLGCQPHDPRAESLLLLLIAQETDTKMLFNARWALAQQQSPPLTHGRY